MCSRLAKRAHISKNKKLPSRSLDAGLFLVWGFAKAMNRACPELTSGWSFEKQLFVALGDYHFSQNTKK